MLEKVQNVEEAFVKDGELFYLTKDEHTCSINKGLIEAFSVQLPEKTGKEFYEYVPHIRDKYSVVESFVQSLLWRKIDTISEKLREYVNSFVFFYRGTYDLFWETILSVTAIPGHYFNAYSLHRHLRNFSLADRDARWTKDLKYKFESDSTVRRLVDWAWSEHNKDHISDESIKLASMALAWLHTSTNRKLRDSSTKALICLLENRINVLIDVLKEFDGVDDPYVYERLFAVSYGCAIRTKQKDALPNLCQYIYQTIFNKEGEIYPHILLRDYARGTIEYAVYLGYDLNIDLTKVRPPYKSTFPKKFPTNKAIDGKYKFNYKSKDFKDYYWGQNNILSSMTTEYGRGIAGYGDFGRYTFQRAFESWDVDANSLSNLAIKWIFEKYGYDVEKHGKFDREIGSGRGRDTYPNERIGKKYQWLALYEMLARVSDNCIKYSEWDYKKESVEPYEGTWNPYVRDIDPTITVKNTGNNNGDEISDGWWAKEHYTNWDLPNKDWIKWVKDLPNTQRLISVADNNDVEWLVLEGHPEWTEPKVLGAEKWGAPSKRLWLQIRSYFVHNNDFKRLKSWATNQSFMGRWMPESQDNYQIFSREYYWSFAHKYFQKEYYDSGQWQNVRNRGSDKTVAQVMVTSESYHWEEEFDESKESTLHILKPCADLYEKLKLVYSDREGEFVDEQGELICFDPSVYHNCKSFLLIQKDNLLKYLQENDLQILWTILGEKIIIGGWPRNETDYPGRQEINGVYYLNKGVIEGKSNSTINL